MKTKPAALSSLICVAYISTFDTKIAIIYLKNKKKYQKIGQIVIYIADNSFFSQSLPPSDLIPTEGYRVSLDRHWGIRPKPILIRRDGPPGAALVHVDRNTAPLQISYCIENINKEIRLCIYLTIYIT